MTTHILIPYNFTANDLKAIDYVAQRYGEQKGVNITLFHADPPIPEINAEDNPLMKKLAQNTAYLRHCREERRAELEKAKERLVSHGFAGHKIQCLFRQIRTDAATDIIRFSREENFDVVVLNRSPGSIVNFFSRSVSKRVARTIEGQIDVHIVS